VDAGGTIHYVSGAYERNVGNGQNTTEVVTKYYHALGRLIAFRKNGVLHWVGTDHLGSTIRVANANFAALDRMRYKPFGESRDPGTGLDTDHKFTGQIEDASTALNGAPLYWYGSRAYDPALGRFVCPDTIVPRPGDPQSLNRYSYVLNNPLKYRDPSGHAPTWDLSDYDGRQKARDYYAGLGVPVVVDDKSIYFREFGITTNQSGDIVRYTGPEDPEDVWGPGGGGSQALAGGKAAILVSTDTGGSRVPETLSIKYLPGHEWLRDRGWPYIYTVNSLSDVHNNLSPFELERYVVQGIAGDGGTIAISAVTILSTISIDPRTRLSLLRHEMGHVKQAKDLGPLYLGTYIGQYFEVGSALEAIGIPGTKGNIYAMHPMEIDANRRAGLPLDWDWNPTSA
jgi:RHS repeat-associated protein